MTPASLSPDAPFTPAPSDRLCNSGWGRPPEQYRTPGIGTSVVLDLPAMLQGWKGATAPDREALRAVAPRHKAYPSSLIARYAVTLASALDATVDDVAADRVLPALEALRDSVAARGLLDGMLLTCSMVEKYKWLRGRQWCFVPTTEQLAAVLAATAFSHGGLVLWSAKPSLGSIRPDYVIHLTWLRRQEAGAAAQACWKGLTLAPQPEEPR